MLEIDTGNAMAKIYYKCLTVNQLELYLDYISSCILHQ